MWTVIKKKDFDEFDAIPQSWVLPNHKEAMYPILQPSAIRKMAERGERIGKHAYELIQIIKYKDYDSYETAYDNAIRYTSGKTSKSASEGEPKGRGLRKKRKSRYLQSSDSSSSEEEVRKKKKKKGKKRIQPSSSSSEENSEGEIVVQRSKKSDEAQRHIQRHLEETEDLALPTIPVYNPKSAQSCDNFMVVTPGAPANADSPRKSPKPCSKISHAKTASSTTSKCVDANRPSTSKSHTEETASPHKSSIDNAKRQLFKGKTSHPNAKCKQGKKIKHPCGFRMSCEPLEAIMHTQCIIGADINEIKYRLKKQNKMEKVKRNESGDDEPKIKEVEMPEKILDQLPLKNKVSLDSFEAQIKTDDKLFKTLVDGFSWHHRNDANITTTARGVLKRIFEVSVLSSYSLKGGSNNKGEKKLPFIELKSYSLIIDVVKALWKHIFPSYKEEADKTLGPYLISCKTPTA